MSEQAVETTAEDSYECLACGYVYQPAQGDQSGNITPGTPFVEISDSWRCPVCKAKKNAFRNIGPANKASGFQENLSYGLGVNVLTPTQKNILIFGALALGFLFFMSLYTLQ